MNVYMDEATKVCFKCKVCKPIKSFYKHPKMSQGRLNKCIECAKIDVRDNRLKKIEYYRQYDRLRANHPHRLAKRLQVAAKYEIDFPKRKKANTAVNNAVRDGRLQKWPCQVCGNERSVGHHADYDNPLGVVWLCQAHHKQTHALAEILQRKWK